ncbi:MAG: hypothetical protein GY895_20200 [Phycisphaera sp.]|nr:hypothetical protein [Phycisphaera sp.]
MVGFAIWLVGCDTTRPKVDDYREYESVRDELSPELAQILLQEYATSVGQAIDLAMLEILDGTTDPTVIANALRFRSAAVAEVRRAALRINPIVGALDSWVLYEQLDRFLRTAGGTAALGDRADVIDRMLETIESDLEITLDRMLVDRDLAKSQVDALVAAQEITSLTLARPSAIAPVARDDARLRTLMDSVATFEFLASAAYHRLGSALDDFPEDLRWQVDLSMRRLLDDEAIKEALTSLDRLDHEMKTVHESIDGLSESLDAEGDLIVASIQMLTQDAMDEVAFVVDDGFDRMLVLVEQERIEAQKEIERQRLETIEVLQAERKLVLEAVSEEREALVRGVAAERDNTMDSLRELVATEAEAAIAVAQVTAMEVVNRLFVGLLVLAGVGLLVVAVPAVVMVFMIRRIGRAG